MFQAAPPFVPFSRDATLNAPIEAWHSGLQLATMLAEANVVVTYRVLGQMGLWATAPGETRRMIHEKPTAFVQAAVAAATAAQAGKRPDEILAAAVGPLGRRTRSNMHRLARRGPGLPK